MARPHLVHRCKECSFYYFDISYMLRGQHWCRHKNIYEKRMTQKDSRVAPKWCPVRKFENTL
jgi:hypothetical protein